MIEPRACASLTIMIVTCLPMITGPATGCSHNNRFRPGHERLIGRGRGLTLKCGLLGAGIGALTAAAITFGGTALVNEKWPLNEPADFVETIPIWGSTLFIGMTLGMYIACLGP
ncbi:MAG: hypothetical protein GXP49_09290 [Deltaproteobacteria bacterium]|nr:hypothetical protein [Deltaproteobacteria bacterium]